MANRYFMDTGAYQGAAWVYINHGCKEDGNLVLVENEMAFSHEAVWIPKKLLIEITEEEYNYIIDLESEDEDVSHYSFGILEKHGVVVNDIDTRYYISRGTGKAGDYTLLENIGCEEEDGKIFLICYYENRYMGSYYDYPDNYKEIGEYDYTTLIELYYVNNDIKSNEDYKNQYKKLLESR